MKKITTIILALLFGIYSRAQTTQTFIKNFETGSGIYGYVEILTMPATYGFASLKIQAKSIVIKGVRINNENITSSTLSNYGVTFPFNCNNCYFYASGTASMFIGYSPEAKFRTSGSIHLRDFTSHTVNFSQVAKDKHNLLVKNGEGSKWETTGSVDNISISGVAGGDLGIISNAIRKYTKSKEREAYYNDYIFKSNRANSNQDKLDLLQKARQYADNTNEVDRLIESVNAKINKEIEKERENIVENQNYSTTNKNENRTSSSKSDSDSNSNSETNNYYSAKTSTKLDRLKEEGRSLSEESRNLRNRTDLTLDEKLRINDAITAANVQNAKETYAEAQRIRIENSSKQNSSYTTNNTTNNYIQSQQFRNDVQVLANSINQLFYVDPVRQAARDKNRKAREKYRNELNRHKANRKMADSDVINLKESGNLKIKKKKNFYGVIDSNNNWIIKPKYLAIKLKKEEEGKKIFWLKKKNLTIDYITIKTQ